jgi:hypothetical protein
LTDIEETAHPSIATTKNHCVALFNLHHNNRICDPIHCEIVCYDNLLQQPDLANVNTFLFPKLKAHNDDFRGDDQTNLAKSQDFLDNSERGNLERRRKNNRTPIVYLIDLKHLSLR